MLILENDKRYLQEFIALNEAWISHYFNLEESDQQLAKHPYQIVEEGGYIFSLIKDDEVIGVCALFNRKNRVFELARMAIDPAHQGNGYANILMQHCLNKLKKLQAKEVYLYSNTCLNTAIQLYKKYQFKTQQTGTHPNYKRANIIMHRRIS